MMSYGLKVFLSVAERGSVTDTANELFVTQPAVSKAIKSLEDKLSLKLFHRDKRKGLTLTDAGRKIFLLARQMRDLEERIYRTAFHENNCLGGTLRVASVPIATTLIVSKVLRRYREKFPAVNGNVNRAQKFAISERQAVDLQKNFVAENFSLRREQIVKIHFVATFS